MELVIGTSAASGTEQIRIWNQKFGPYRIYLRSNRTSAKNTGCPMLTRQSDCSGGNG